MVRLISISVPALNRVHAEGHIPGEYTALTSPCCQLVGIQEWLKSEFVGPRCIQVSEGLKAKNEVSHSSDGSVKVSMSDPTVEVDMLDIVDSWAVGCAASVLYDGQREQS